LSADHPLIGLDVRVGPGNDGDDTPYEFVGILAGDVSSWATTVLRSDGKLCAVANDRVTFRDPCHAARKLRTHAAAQDVTTDGRTLSQVCTELVEAKQAAARLNDALRDLAVELGLPMGLPQNAIMEAIRVKMVVVRYTPPRWVPAKDVEVGWPFLAAVDPDGEYIALEPSGKRLLPGDVAVFGSRDALVLIGEWPPLPNGKP
jgi:hypothetical protein